MGLRKNPVSRRVFALTHLTKEQGLFDLKHSCCAGPAVIGRESDRMTNIARNVVKRHANRVAIDIAAKNSSRFVEREGSRNAAGAFKRA